MPVASAIFLRAVWLLRVQLPSWIYITKQCINNVYPREAHSSTPLPPSVTFSHLLSLRSSLCLRPTLPPPCFPFSSYSLAFSLPLSSHSARLSVRVSFEPDWLFPRALWHTRPQQRGILPRNSRDTCNFDREFTKMAVEFTPTDKLFIMNLDQDEFLGFSFTNPEYVAPSQG
ncbi:Protein kinase C beta type [Triplophysa tibetana]|uniref:Protein kinase C beta type n=1 Tax=Triplophysa tibetana TaxID=1572043 RepID=A0A5A9N9B8_9TELE|nr:Protein kinase C beta type [Triplophysa tibetana]